MKGEPSFRRAEFSERFDVRANILRKTALFFARAIGLAACTAGSPLTAADNKLEVNTEIVIRSLEEKGGYFYPTNTYVGRLLAGKENANVNEYYAFHIANYALDGKDAASLQLDTANLEKQLKVSFLIKKKEMRNLSELIG